MAKQKFVWLKTTYFGKPDINAAKITCLNLGNSHNKVCVFYQTSGNINNVETNLPMSVLQPPWSPRSC